ncbi:MAG: hypothetical protein KKB50_05855 [Planctomycetes bacterium]|nr:hypothetical protein [Planctomycetota bacterium]
MVKTLVAILGATGMLSLVAVGWNADTPSAPAQETEITTSAEACQAIRAAGLCERDLGGKCTPERCHAAKRCNPADCDPADCDPAKCDPAACPGHGPEGCNPASCHPAEQGAERAAHCNPVGCDPTNCDPGSCLCHGPKGCDPSKCPGHGPEGCDPAKCPGHGPEGCDPAKCPGHAAADSAAESDDRASQDAAPTVRERRGGCSRDCRGHGASQP